ncbi:UDP-3-O-(3-hydroxymyristoyl)glucosamine N-acyltransferase [Alienimonas californiensis]|uniref:UDP-3-O-acylglucosamine N-acyltransferase n=1 Tax=Alienimonas californiensis TaxID=2527989 RepID=A0A517PDT9_9PLAN|nr:UDP-3-O-(3-hydroxymyristoyl)glucosamine N-acyltransferase [Alienimonas californiensis]QDT17553.1 UDP-3-O-acylglucosamine N-acyltransferase [Alienimonas californiensis]
MPLLGDLLPDCPPSAAEVEVTGVGTATHAKPGDLLFLADPQAASLPADCPAAAVLVEPGLEGKAEKFPGAVVPLSGARAAFVALLPTLAPRRTGDKQGVSKAAYVHPSATIAESATVYPGATISEHAVLGEGCVVYPGAFVGPGCTLGERVVLHPNCVLHDGVHLADGVTVQAGAVLGQDGFGFDSDASGHRHLPHHGGVRVGKGALIGANTTVARGMVADTYLGEGTVTDAQVVIAHNCDIGPHNLFCSQVGIAGSVTTGSFVIAAARSGILDHVTVCDHVTLGGGSGMTRDCRTPGTYLGAPAQPADAEVKVMMASRKLPEMRQTLKVLQKQVAALAAKIERMEAGNDPAAAPELSLREAA